MSRTKLAKNQAYLRNLTKRLPEIVPTILAETSMRIYQKMLEYTKVDSGQAIDQWYIVPSTGGNPNYPDQQITWGFGDTPPIAPVGWKTWGGNPDEGEHLKVMLIEYEINLQLQVYNYILSNKDIENVYVFNPISPGFALFQPGGDNQYQSNALGRAMRSIPAVSEQARAEAYQAAKAKFPELLGKTRGPKA